MQTPEQINAKITSWEKEIIQVTAQFNTHFGNLSGAELDRKPAPDKWSIAEILDHLIRINESYYPVVKQVRAGTLKLPFMAKFGFMTNLLGNFILKSVAPDRKTKVKTFPIWEPKPIHANENMLARFEQHQQELISFMKSSRDLLEKETVITSPANKMIVYKLEKAFDILVDHEKRHLNQALEVLKGRQ